MAEDFTINPADGTWVVRAGGAVLGESENAIEVTMNGHMIVYFPSDDIATVFLDPSDKVGSTPLGEASYYSIVTKSTTLRNAGWKLDKPVDAAGEIAGYLAFESTDQVAVEKL